MACRPFSEGRQCHVMLPAHQVLQVLQGEEIQVCFSKVKMGDFSEKGKLPNGLYASRLRRNVLKTFINYAKATKDPLLK